MSNRERVLLPRGQIWPPSQASHLHKKITSFAQKRRFNCENSGKKVTPKPSASFLLMNSECFSHSADQDLAQPSSPRNSIVVERGMLQLDKTPDLDSWRPKNKEMRTGFTVPDG